MSSNDLVLQSLKQFKIDTTSQRNQDIEKRLNIYHDNYKQIIETEVNNQFTEETRDAIKQMVDDSLNVLKRVINEISVVYHEDATRKALIQKTDGTQEEDQVYKDLLSNIPTDLVMELTNRYTNLLNESIIYIVPRNGHIEYDIITPDQVHIRQDEKDPRKIEAIMFTRTWTDTFDDIKIEKVYWDTNGNHRTYDENDKLIEDFGNPYIDPNDKEKTILPFVIFHKNYNPYTVFDETSGSDLVSSAIQIGVLSTYLNYLLKMNSFKQLAVIGIETKNVPMKYILDPSYPIVIPDSDGDIKTVDYETAFNLFWNIIVEKIGVIANANGLSMENFKLTLSAQSGVALRIKNLGLEKVIKEQVKHYRVSEKELFEKTRIINNKQFDQKINEDAEFMIDFKELQYPEVPEEIRKQWIFDIAMGSKNILQYLMEVNPDIQDLEKAKEVLLANVEVNDQVKAETSIGIQDLIDGVLDLKGGSTSNSGGESSLI